MEKDTDRVIQVLCQQLEMANFAGINFEISANPWNWEFTFNCSSKEQALEVCWKNKAILSVLFWLNFIPKITILYQGIVHQILKNPYYKFKLEATMKLPATFTKSNSIWVKQNPEVAELLTQMGTLCIHRADLDSGMPAIAIHPYLNNPRHLNKPIEELLHQPMKAAKPNVAHNKLIVAETCLETGEREQISYVDRWSATGEERDLRDWHLTYRAWIEGDEIIMVGFNNEISERTWWELSS